MSGYVGTHVVITGGHQLAGQSGVVQDSYCNFAGEANCDVKLNHGNRVARVPLRFLAIQDPLARFSDPDENGST